MTARQNFTDTLSNELSTSEQAQNQECSPSLSTSNNNEKTHITLLHEQLVNAISNAKQTLPIQKHQHTNPWDDDDALQKLLYRRRIAVGQEKELKLVGKLIKERVSILKNIHLKEQADAINEAQVSRNSVEEWRRAKEHSEIIKRKPKPIPCKGLKEHFIAHFNPDHSKLPMPAEISSPPSYITNLHALIKSDSGIFNNNPPTDEEIADAISKLKPRKSSVDVEAETLKAGYSESTKFKEEINKYFKSIWIELQVPEQWSLSALTALWKNKGSPSDPIMYRGINVSSLFVKVAMNIVLTRIDDFYNTTLLRTQFGFRSGRGCNDAIYAIKQLQDISHKSNRKLYTCYVDLSAAYDHIPRKFLFHSIHNRLPPGKYTCIDIVEKLYERTRAVMKGDTLDDAFEYTSGVRQGGNESGAFYNMYADYAIRVWRDKCIELGLPTLNIPYLIPAEATNRAQKTEYKASGTIDDCECGLADDTGIHSWEIKTLQQSVQLLYDTFARFGLSMNLVKTQTMVWNWNEEIDGPYPNTIIKINDQHLENVKEFKYLGVWNTYNDVHIGQRELNHRIGSAAGAYYKNRQLLTNSKVWLKTRVKFMNAIVRSRLIYGCHAWRPTQKEMRKLNATYNSYLRRIVTGGYRRKRPPPKNSSMIEEKTDMDQDYDMGFIINNTKLYQITGQQPLSKTYECQQENWVKHVIRQPNSALTKNLMFECVKSSRYRVESVFQRVLKRQQVERGQFIRDSFQR